jgi:phage tail sheath protein FI
MQQCAAVGNRFVLLDVFRSSKDLESDIVALRAALPGDTNLLRNAAAYAPRIIAPSGIAGKDITLPSAPAIAGIFVYTDKTKGIWKAPANINITGVSVLEEMISDKEQGGFNVDTVGGKSVNAIRSFTGKGNAIVWGARTLAGNDNEWRYIPVRRFIMMIEASVKNGLQQFAFEFNDANTWTRLRQAVENFLIWYWQNGALQGNSADKAFYVRCGLGATMTNLDILEGRLIAEIGLAVIRPAEFIVLRFTQRMQAS